MAATDNSTIWKLCVHITESIIGIRFDALQIDFHGLSNCQYDTVDVINGRNETTRGNSCTKVVEIFLQYFFPLRLLQSIWSWICMRIDRHQLCCVRIRLVVHNNKCVSLFVSRYVDGTFKMTWKALLHIQNTVHSSHSICVEWYVQSSICSLANHCIRFLFPIFHLWIQ